MHLIWNKRKINLAMKVTELNNFSLLTIILFLLKNTLIYL